MQDSEQASQGLGPARGCASPGGRARKVRFPSSVRVGGRPASLFDCDPRRGGRSAVSVPSRKRCPGGGGFRHAGCAVPLWFTESIPMARSPRKTSIHPNPHDGRPGTSLIGVQEQHPPVTLFGRLAQAAALKKGQRGRGRLNCPAGDAWCPRVRRGLGCCLPGKKKTKKQAPQTRGFVKRARLAFARFGPAVAANGGPTITTFQHRRRKQRYVPSPVGARGGPNRPLPFSLEEPPHPSTGPPGFLKVEQPIIVKEKPPNHAGPRAPEIQRRVAPKTKPG